MESDVGQGRMCMQRYVTLGEKTQLTSRYQEEERKDAAEGAANQPFLFGAQEDGESSWTSTTTLCQMLSACHCCCLPPCGQPQDIT